MDHNEMEAEIVKTIYAPTYSHAENVLILLREQEKKVGIKKAIEFVHGVVCEKE